MKKAVIEVDHLPTGRNWVSKIETMPDDEFETWKTACENYGRLSSLAIQTESGEKIAFSQAVLKKCIVKFKEVI